MERVKLFLTPINSKLYLMETNNAVIAIDLLEAGLVSNENLASIPVNFKLHDNYPNPFNPSTNIQYDLPVASDVSIKIYDIQGRMIANISKGKQTAGTYTHRFDAGSLASGMYIYRIEAGSFIATKKDDVNKIKRTKTVTHHLSAVFIFVKRCLFEKGTFFNVR